jgi:hypothetical protein
LEFLGVVGKFGFGKNNNNFVAQITVGLKLVDLVGLTG